LNYHPSTFIEFPDQRKYADAIIRPADSFQVTGNSEVMGCPAGDAGEKSAWTKGFFGFCHRWV